MITITELNDFRNDVPPMSEQAYEHGLNRLRADMGQRRRSHRWWYAGVAVAAAAACLVTGVVAVSGHQPSNSAAAEILQDAAARAKLKPTLHPKPGQWVYHLIKTVDGGTPDTVELWVPADASTGTQVVTDTGGPGPSRTDVYRPGVSPLDQAPYDVFAALPTNPSAMIARIAADPCGRPDPSRGHDLAIWTCGRMLVDLLPPAQQVALFQGLAGLHGVRRIGSVTMFTGRRGIALGMQDPNLHGDIQMVFATDTHEYIGEQVVVPDQQQPEFNFATIRVGVVSRALQRP